jgi:four helix bundle protein
MTPNELKDRTKTFGIEVVKFCRTLLQDVATSHVVDQLVRSGTAVGSNYRAACRAKSRADFISKMTNVEEEADESIYWLEVLVGTDTVTHKRTATLHAEAEELLKIVVASIKTAKNGRR